MNSNRVNFDSFRQCAARSFARTMIVVDDEADFTRSPARPTTLVTPGRSLSKSLKNAQDDSIVNTPPENSMHALDAKQIIDEAMNLGLICSVMCPAEKEKDFEERIVKASRFADIVSLDWEIGNDQGDAASRMVRRILEEDDKMNGRVRCIAIYTGYTTNNKILEKVLAHIPQKIREKQEMRRTNLEISGKYGLRIVCLFKSHGILLKDARKVNQVAESDLPKRLQDEFAKLSEGILSNVALATIASIRQITHQVLARFSGNLDGPWFHHRATITNPEEAEEYAVNVVLSEIKGAVDIREVGKKHAGYKAIAARIQEIANEHGSNPQQQTLRCNQANSVNFDLALKDVVKFVKSGLPEENIMSDGKYLSKTKIKDVIKPHFSSLFYRNWSQAEENMGRFASLTGVRSYPGAYPGCHLPSPQWVPMLGLGTIIKPEQEQALENGDYLLCLQASCDAVRLDQAGGSFIFIPLVIDSETCPNELDHVVPVPNGQGGFKHIGLKVPKISYRALLTITFPPSFRRVVEAKRSKNPGKFIFLNCSNQKYTWIAEIKRRRALRTVQDLRQQLGRLGFDEFEPYRKSRS
ncbi:MAG: response regulator receiver domain [Gammaproteobacteria bacterium]|nr:response regulator receiver domain [Gammaproteobacteria bacterium]MCY4228518.1 response regulator receiver domain [Gammaproteobacteria bacterium]